MTRKLFTSCLLIVVTLLLPTETLGVTFPVFVFGSCSAKLDGESSSGSFDHNDAVWSLTKTRGIPSQPSSHSTVTVTASNPHGATQTGNIDVRCDDNAVSTSASASATCLSYYPGGGYTSDHEAWGFLLVDDHDPSASRATFSLQMVADDVSVSLSYDSLLSEDSVHVKVTVRVPGNPDTVLRDEMLTMSLNSGRWSQDVYNQVYEYIEGAHALQMSCSGSVTNDPNIQYEPIQLNALAMNLLSDAG